MLHSGFITGIFGLYADDMKNSLDHLNPPIYQLAEGFGDNKVLIRGHDYDP